MTPGLPQVPGHLRRPQTRATRALAPIAVAGSGCYPSRLSSGKDDGIAGPGQEQIRKAWGTPDRQIGVKHAPGPQGREHLGLVSQQSCEFLLRQLSKPFDAEACPGIPRQDVLHTEDIGGVLTDQMCTVA